eukprot:7357142-Prymnesium_polylepis.1
MPFRPTHQPTPDRGFSPERSPVWEFCERRLVSNKAFLVSCGFPAVSRTPGHLLLPAACSVKLGRPVVGWGGKCHAHLDTEHQARLLTQPPRCAGI